MLNGLKITTNIYKFYMKNILVTGGTGYIGSHTVLSLLMKGYKVTIIDSFFNSSPNVINRINLILKDIDPKLSKNLKLIIGDVRDNILVNKVFKQAEERFNHFESVIHFAGLKSVSQSKKEPLNYWDVNMNGTINLLKTMDKYNCRNFIFSSSATVYGETNKPPFKESFKLDPISPYANNKACIEKFLEDVFNSKKENWNIVNLRYFNPIGAHHSGIIGENPLGKPTNIFPILLNACSGKEEFRIFGNDWPTYDGTCIRDYIHVEDLADGHIKALECSSLKGLNTINLGTGKGTSVLELIQTFEKTNGIKIKYNFAERRKGDTAILVADNTFAINKLNWKPKRNLSDMCKDGFNWISQNPNGYND